MSGKVNRALFDLIKSMSKSEKRYFKLMASRHTIGSENNYVRLFDFIDKLDAYDEDRIFKTFRGEAFLNRFSITKKRLYDHILTALDSFHSSNSIEAQLNKQLHAADILFEKSLYDQCRRVLKSAEKFAEKHELSGILVQIGIKQKRLLETQGYANFSENDLKHMIGTDQLHARRIAVYNTIWGVKCRLFGRLAQKGVARSEEEMHSYEAICEGLLEDFTSMDLDTETSYLYHHTLSAYCYAIGDLPGSLEHIERNLEHIQCVDFGKKTEISKYLSLLTNAIYISDKIGRYKDSLRYLVELKKIEASVDSNEDVEIKLFSSIRSIELSMFLRKGEFSRALEVINCVENKLDKYGAKIVPVRRAFLEFKVAGVYMGIGDFPNALRWINRVLNNNRLDETEDIIGFTQLLELLVYIEMGYWQLLPYSYKNTKRFFKTRNRMYSFERVLLQYISKLIKCENVIDQKNLWEGLYKELQSVISEDTFERVALDYFDFESWAESKLKGKSFDLLVREKYNQRTRIAS